MPGALGFAGVGTDGVVYSTSLAGPCNPSQNARVRLDLRAHRPDGRVETVRSIAGRFGAAFPRSMVVRNGHLIASDSLERWMVAPLGGGPATRLEQGVWRVALPLDVSAVGELLVFLALLPRREYGRVRTRLRLLSVGEPFDRPRTIEHALTGGFCGDRLVTWNAGSELQVVRVRDAAGAVIDKQSRSLGRGEFSSFACDANRFVGLRLLNRTTRVDIFDLP
jgi:hypothetical protein